LGSGKVIEVVAPTHATVDASRVTFRHLLTHTSGLPAWLPLWKVALALRRDGVASADIKQKLHAMASQSAFAYPTGARVVYSDVGLILVGLAIEQLAGASLDAVVRERVTGPLSLDAISYGPISCDTAAPTEFYVHHGRRMCGQVHDENAFALNGVAGHAGLFGNARDVAAFGETLRTALAGTSKQPILRQATLQEMTQLQAQDGDVRRGIGFALWSPNPRAMSHPLSESTFGHLGFTGTSLWIDPERELTFVCLTNHIYYGRAGEDTMTPFRVALAQAAGFTVPAASTQSEPRTGWWRSTLN
jgi:CubicO group peptidase (beta-lactamase class C family)